MATQPIYHDDPYLNRLITERDGMEASLLGDIQGPYQITVNGWTRVYHRPLDVQNLIAMWNAKIEAELIILGGCDPRFDARVSI